MEDDFPPIRISPVRATGLSWRYIEGQTPVDFTQVLDGAGWSAEFIIENCGAVYQRSACTLDANGYVSVTVPAETAQALRSSRRIDASFQISFTAPLPDFSMVWQGPVVVMEIIA